MTDNRCTVSGKDPDPNAHYGAPTDEKKPDGQYKDHYVLCQEERAKGYVRPLREKYIHVGRPGPTFKLRDLTQSEKETFGSDYVKYEEYPKGFRGTALGHLWSQQDLDKVNVGCGTETVMPMACAETYARDPMFYGSTFCCGCGDYFPVGRDGEFVWSGTRERVGT